MTTDSNAASIDAANNFHAFMRGWRHAASGKAKDGAHVNHHYLARAYMAGYETGRAAFAHAGACAEVRFGHTPNPLREAAQP